MTAPFLSPGFRATDSDDNPLAGGYISFYAANSTTPKAVYSDADLSTSLGTTVNLNSAGAPVSGSNTPVLIYPGLGDYKIRYYDADDTLIFEFDDYPGAVAEEEAATTATPTFPVISKTSSYTVTTDERGKLINANPTGGSFAITLPSAVTVGDNFVVGIRHNGTANAVSLLTTGSQNIRFQGNRTAFSLNGQGETLWLVSDGSDWIGCGYVPPFRKDLAPYFIVLDSLASPPANPDSGARYLISGTPTGVWSTLGFADEDIAEADGNGSWIKHTPSEGWMAFDVDEGISYVFREGAWENFQIDPGESTLKTFIVQDQKASNTDGGTATTDAWTTAVLNTSVVNTITDASLASNKITLPAGRYRVRARKVFSTTGETRIRFKKDVAGTVVGLSESVHAGNVVSTQSANAIVGITAALECEFEISESTDFVLEYYVNVNQHTTATQGLGIPSNISGVVEVYATVTVEDIAAQQGPKGDQGDVGEGGLDAAYAYQFNTATSGDPGSGKILVNNATPASVTQIAVNQTDANGADLTAVIASWDDSTSATSKARIRWHKEGDPQNFFEFLITGTGTDQGSYWTFPVTYVSHGGTISNGNDIAMLVVQTGDIGDPGTTVPDISGLTPKTSPSLTDDYAIIYDDAGSSHKSYLPYSRTTGLTAVDSASWAQALGMRIGADMDADGSGVDGSANEFGLVIHTNTTSSTSGTAPYEKAALLVIAQTSDPSTTYDRDTVGVDMRGCIAADNALGRAWGGYSEGRILAGGDGLLYAHEFYTVNNGTDQASADTTTSKYGLHLVAGGSTNSTAGLKFSGVGGTKFHVGFYFDTAGVATHALYLPSVFSLRMTGAMGFGTDSPDRLVHAEVADAGTNTVVHAARLSHVTSGTAAVGLGVGQEWELENASGTNRVAGTLECDWLDATNAAEYGRFRMRVIKNGSNDIAMIVDAFGLITAAGAFAVGANQVVGARDTGWTAMTGSADKSTSYATGSVTTAQLAGRVMAIQAALTTHGLLGA